MMPAVTLRLARGGHLEGGFRSRTEKKIVQLIPGPRYCSAGEKNGLHCCAHTHHLSRAASFTRNFVRHIHIHTYIPTYIHTSIHTCIQTKRRTPQDGSPSNAGGLAVDPDYMPGMITSHRACRKSSQNLRLRPKECRTLLWSAEVW